MTTFSHRTTPPATRPGRRGVLRRRGTRRVPAQPPRAADPGDVGLPPGGAGARRACAARRSPARRRRASPGTPGWSRPATSTSPSRCSTRSPGRCCSTRTSAATCSPSPAPPEPDGGDEPGRRRPRSGRCSTSCTRTRRTSPTAATTCSPTTGLPGARRRPRRAALEERNTLWLVFTRPTTSRASRTVTRRAPGWSGSCAARWRNTSPSRPGSAWSGGCRRPRRSSPSCGSGTTWPTPRPCGSACSTPNSGCCSSRHTISWLASWAGLRLVAYVPADDATGAALEEFGGLEPRPIS